MGYMSRSLRLRYGTSIGREHLDSKKTVLLNSKMTLADVSPNRECVRCYKVDLTDCY